MKKGQHNKHQSSSAPAIAISVALHVVLFGAMLWGADFTSVKQQPVGNSIQAVVIDPGLVSQQANKIRQQREQAKREESDRIRRLEQQAELLEKQREQEENRLRELKTQKLAAEKEAREAEQQRKKIAAQRKKAEEEKRKSDEAARVAKKKAADAEADRKRKVAEQKKAQQAAKKAEADAKRAEEARKQKLAEQKKAEEEARKAEEVRKQKLAEKKKAEEDARKAEQARKEAERRAEEARKKQQEQEAALDDLFSGLTSESESRSTARGRFTNDEMARYGAIYTQMIQQNLLVDNNLKGLECVVKMRLSSSGLLLDVNEVGGNSAVCRATKTAVLKVSSFPMPEDAEVAAQVRNIELTVKPE